MVLPGSQQAVQSLGSVSGQRHHSGKVWVLRLGGCGTSPLLAILLLPLSFGSVEGASEYMCICACVCMCVCGQVVKALDCQ